MWRTRKVRADNMIPIQVATVGRETELWARKSILISYPVLGGAISVQVMATPTSQINLKFIVFIEESG